jgi:hypothetical protein
MKKNTIEGIVELTTAVTRLKSIEIASNGNHSQDCKSLKSSFCSCLEPTQQLEPITFSVLFIFMVFGRYLHKEVCLANVNIKVTATNSIFMLIL